MLKNKKIVLALLLIVQIIIVKVLPYFAETVEKFYSCGIYNFTSKFERYIFSWLPFSFGDLLYGFAMIYVIRWFVVNRKRIIKDTKNWLLDIIATASVIYFAFHLFWGFNYYRLPIHKKMAISNEYTTESLIDVTEQLILKVNDLQKELAENDSTKVTIPYSKKDILEKVPLGYDQLSKKHSFLSYQAPCIKKSLFSLPLTYMGFSGYLNPITNEAQVDDLIPEFKFPTTASHEVAHQLGYAAENEANFIGFLAATTHPDRYFKYSGYAFGLRHCLVEIYRREPELYADIISTLNIGTRKNYQEVSDFWDSYKNPLEPIFKTTYSGFLKANQQKGGIESYSYVVALLVNYLENNPN